VEHKVEHKSALSEEFQDVRIKATATIWGLCVPLLGVSIPLAAITSSAFVPLAVICGAAIATASVWIFANRNPQGAQNDAALLAAQKQIKDLEERLANLETINNFERRLAEEALARQNAVGEVAKDAPSASTTVSAERLAQ
jgi:hypothetical protein